MVMSLGRVVVKVMSCCAFWTPRITATRLPSGDTATLKSVVVPAWNCGGSCRLVALSSVRILFAVMNPCFASGLGTDAPGAVDAGVEDDADALGLTDGVALAATLPLGAGLAVAPASRPSRGNEIATMSTSATSATVARTARRPYLLRRGASILT